MKREKSLIKWLRVVISLTAFIRSKEEGNIKCCIKKISVTPTFLFKFLRLFAAVFGLSTVIVRYFPLFFHGLRLNETYTFAFTYFISIIVLLFVVPYTLIPYWAYKDLGLRIRDSSNAEVFVPGSQVIRSLTGFGILVGALAGIFSFVSTGIGQFFVFVLLIIVPPCLLYVALFNCLENRLIEKLKRNTELTEMCENAKLQSEMVL
ncbi:MAG: hypothetical protein M1351_02230 [Candidatus Thermoplasmatota archaeon]|nr:hypothetical protein [Candidatus Thermoplasmatota archaeon]